MINLQDCEHCPTIEEISEYIGNPLFNKFCSEIQIEHGTKTKIEFSKCSWASGWNIKFKKSGRTLCTVYPGKMYFTVLVVIGKKEKNRAETLLRNCSVETQEIYDCAKEGNGQKWIMINLKTEAQIYYDVLKLIKTRIPQKVLNTD